MRTYEELVKEYRTRQHDTVVDTIATGLTYMDEIAVDTGLLEETGIVPQELIGLGTYYPSVAYTDEVIWLYLARVLSCGDQNPDDDEFLNVEYYPLDELVDMVMRGEIPDGKTQTAILKAKKTISEERF